jgi:hypothetical protein
MLWRLLPLRLAFMFRRTRARYSPRDTGTTRRGQMGSRSREVFECGGHNQVPKPPGNGASGADKLGLRAKTYARWL